MKISVKVKPNQKIQKVEFITGNEYVVRLKSLPIDGKANQELISLLSKHFDVTKKDIEIISGHFSSNKLIEIQILN
ncbi:DUF167 domain-containing protein (plasmid) [Leptospira sp. WS39.C2]